MQSQCGVAHHITGGGAHTLLPWIIVAYVAQSEHITHRLQLFQAYDSWQLRRVLQEGSLILTKSVFFPQTRRWSSNELNVQQQDGITYPGKDYGHSLSVG